MGKPNLEVFADTLLELGLKDRDVLVVTSDSRGSGKLTGFGKRLPDQIIEIGIAEQNLVGVAAGLASAGKKPFAVSPACFLTARSLEQIKNDVAYSDQPVRLVGISAGVSYGALGTTHHSLHDLAALQTINNISIVLPADNYETREAVLAVWENNQPVYLRFGKKAMPDLPHAKGDFEIGKGRTLCKGNDIAFIATGETVLPAYQAAGLLASYGIQCSVISMHTVKPLDTDLLETVASSCKAIVTVEEHSVHGGLGSTCAAYLLQAGYAMPFRIAAIPDEPTVNGSQEEIFNHYGISAKGLAGTALQLLGVKEETA
jgi:transketolase